MRFVGIGLVFFALAGPAFGRVPPDDPVPVAPLTAANAWSDGPDPTDGGPKAGWAGPIFVPPPCRRCN